MKYYIITDINAEFRSAVSFRIYVHSFDLLVLREQFSAFFGLFVFQNIYYLMEKEVLNKKKGKMPLKRIHVKHTHTHTETELVWAVFIISNLLGKFILAQFPRLSIIVLSVISLQRMVLCMLREFSTKVWHWYHNCQKKAHLSVPLFVGGKQA